MSEDSPISLIYFAVGEDNASHNYNLRKKVGKKTKMARKDLVTKLQETLDYVTGKKRPLEDELGIPKSKFPGNDWVCLVSDNNILLSNNNNNNMRNSSENNVVTSSGIQRTNGDCSFFFLQLLILF
jgi:hypothetical protein